MMSTSTGDFYAKKFLSYHWRSISSRRAPIFNKSELNGKLLADALGYYHFDNGSLVEEACGGESAAKSLKEQNEEEFRDSETEVLKQLSSRGQLVVCAGNEMVAKNVIEEGVQIPVTELSTAESCSETGGNQVLAQLVMVYEERKGGYATADASVHSKK
ncbi:putative inactive shikimate kinase like 1, chloroplastic [Vitis vinifera]|uniref:Putative inactive shikimate kinase like 1, chloroplastic n=1 Tax=Vitis vinifera TaxID=29760 RepID=A0A438CN31_VITVI|nr:putative inactive shikimate kinase like 1, chloroplastic [Vitis vinifera]RVW24611.1 putative inactive shikimate kinase like 1, chloroplastic [Vitis vinifera]